MSPKSRADRATDPPEVLSRIHPWPLPASDAAIPWFVSTSLQSLPLSSHGQLLCVLCLLPFCPYRTPVLGFKAHPNPGQSHLEILLLIVSAKILMPLRF